MAILQIICKDCGAENCLCGWTENSKRQLDFENLNEDESHDLQEKVEIMDEWDCWNGNCPNCGSENVISF